MQSISLRWVLPPHLTIVKTAPQYNFQGSLRYVSPALWLQLGPLTPLCCTSPFFDHPRLPADQLLLVPRVFCLAPAVAGLFSDMILVFTKKNIHLNRILQPSCLIFRLPSQHFSSSPLPSNCPPTVPFPYSPCLLSSSLRRGTFHKGMGVFRSVRWYIVGILNSASYRVGFSKHLQDRWMPAHWKTKIKIFIVLIEEHRAFQSQSCNAERGQGGRVCVHWRRSWQIS